MPLVLVPSLVSIEQCSFYILRYTKIKSVYTGGGLGVVSVCVGGVIRYRMLYGHCMDMKK